MKKQYARIAGAGVDVHLRFSSVTFRDSHQKIVRRERLDHTDRQQLRHRLAQWPKGLPVVVESSFGWPWLTDLMREAGLNVCLANCLKVEKMRRLRAEAKSNRKDADLLSHLLFEHSRWWKVWPPPPAVRQVREWTRHRSQLVKLQTGTKNRIHAILHRHGIFHDFSDLFGTRGRAFLEQLCVHGDQRLSAGGHWALCADLRVLRQVRAELASILRELRRQLKDRPVVRLLQTIPGVGLLLAYVLYAEIGRIDRFGSTKALASYALLAPRASDSGEADPTRAPIGRRLGTRGNRTLKWAMLTAARGAVCRGGRWRQIYDRYTNGGKVNRNRGYIKVGRILIGVVRAVWRSGQAYRPDGQAEQAGGNGPAKQTSRSGTGEPSPAMVGA